jgi:hypothetical protein
VVLDVPLAEAGDALAIGLSLEEGAGRPDVVPPRVVAVGEEVPLDPEAARHLHERRDAALGELDAADPSAGRS